MSGSQCFESLQVIGQPVQQFVFKADSIVFGYGNDDADTHID